MDLSVSFDMHGRFVEIKYQRLTKIDKKERRREKRSLCQGKRRCVQQSGKGKKQRRATLKMWKVGKRDPFPKYFVRYDLRRPGKVPVIYRKIKRDHTIASLL
jgi:hypothetical protein